LTQVTFKESNFLITKERSINPILSEKNKDDQLPSQKLIQKSPGKSTFSRFLRPFNKINARRRTNSIRRRRRQGKRPGKRKEERLYVFTLIDELQGIVLDERLMKIWTSHHVYPRKPQLQLCIVLLPTRRPEHTIESSANPTQPFHCSS
jgi:hypothetical protein